jgi:hypothetical protein
MPCSLVMRQRCILSRVIVTIDGYWIVNWIYWVSIQLQCITLHNSQLSLFSSSEDPGSNHATTAATNSYGVPRHHSLTGNSTELCWSWSSTMLSRRNWCCCCVVQLRLSWLSATMSSLGWFLVSLCLSRLQNNSCPMLGAKWISITVRRWLTSTASKWPHVGPQINIITVLLISSIIHRATLGAKIINSITVFRLSLSFFLLVAPRWAPN